MSLVLGGMNRTFWGIEMNEKDQEELEKIVYSSNNVVRDIYEWVIADRKRIVEPLIKYNPNGIIGIGEAIKQTLINAGMEQ